MSFLDHFFQKTNRYLCVGDLYGNILDANPAFLKRLGWPEGKKPTTFEEICLPETHRQLNEAILRINRSMQVTRFSMEGPVRTYTGETQRFVFRAEYFPEAKRFHCRAEELHEQPQFLESLLDASPTVIYAKDLAGNFLFINRKFEETFQVHRSEVIGRSVFSVFPEDQARVMRENDLKVLSSGRMEVSFEEALHPDGVLHHYYSEKFPLYNADGEAFAICGISNDITTQRQTETRLIHASKMSTLGEMAAGISHEINNPLAVIVGRATQIESLVQSGDLTPAKAAELAGKIISTGLRISSIIKGLRSFARLTDQDPFSPVPLFEIIRDTLELCQERIKAHDIHLTVDCPKEVIVECRSTEISQVLLNLLSNAFDAVTACDPQHRHITIRAQKEGTLASIRVLDSGPGVPETIRNRIMMPFFTTKSVGNGTGLGLSISQGIAQAHLGRLYLESGCPQTTFVLELPLSHPAH